MCVITLCTHSTNLENFEWPWYSEHHKKTKIFSVRSTQNTTNGPLLPVSAQRLLIYVDGRAQVTTPASTGKAAVGPTSNNLKAEARLQQRSNRGEAACTH